MFEKHQSPRGAHPFEALARQAKEWLATPSDSALQAMADKARAATALVPKARKRDWEVLLASFAKGGAATRQRARVQGLVRACRLFTPKNAPPALRPTPGPTLDLHAPVDRLPGLGPTSRDVLAERGVTTVGDLVWTLPVAWDDLRTPLSIAEAVEQASADKTSPPLALASLAPRPAKTCVRAIVKTASLVPMRGRRSVRVVFADADEPARLLYATWFFAAHGVLAAATAGKACLLVGRLRIDDRGRAQMIHPDVIADVPGARAVRPRYPRIGVPEGALRKSIAAALDGLARVPDPVPAAIAVREGFLPSEALLRAVHGIDGVLPEPPPEEVRRALFERLAWVEAIVRVWERLRIEAGRGRMRAPPLPIDPSAKTRLEAEFHFKLTGAQSRAIATISRELAREQPMRRLLLGDVGTGKTAVALAGAAQCIAAGWQVAILAPTTVLAEQYMDAVAPLARATSAPIALVTGGRTSARRRAEAQIAAGKIAVVIGTHALLGEGVSFARLGLVIVDEQQRLGVAQRLSLVAKGQDAQGTAPTAPEGKGIAEDRGRKSKPPRERDADVRPSPRAWPHLLTLSATPIPRTMALALRGELGTSVLDERPAGRLPTATSMVPAASVGDVVEEVRAACARGERAFWVCPRIEEADDGAPSPPRGPRADDGPDELDDIPSAASRAAELTASLSPFSVTLIHGGMRPEAKRRAMRAFRAGDAQVLVGTTVVEVGVDVPEATLMVVEGAERFGLSQLHQLRGRVGRGERPGRCILVHGLSDAPEAVASTALARRRLEVLCTVSSGADIARADLELRGAGDLGGTRQSGEEAGLLYLDLASPPPWLARIEDDARAIFTADPELSEEKHEGLGLFVRKLALAIAVRDEAG